MPRKRKCRVCKQAYLPALPEQRVCSIECGVPYGRELALKAREDAQKARKATFLRNDKGRATKLAQKAFNSFIRERDRDKPCVSCGRYHNGQYHAGHYRPTGGQGSALRFNEINCHRQCAPCNNHKSGNLSEYRIELIRRIGLPLVEWLEKDHPPANWTVEELHAVKDYYIRAKKEMYACPEATNTPF